MSDIRRLLSTTAIDTLPHTERNLEAIARAVRLRPRGSDLPAEKYGIINIQHWTAHTLLQKATLGARTPTAWETKKGGTMHATYVRQGYRANISRKWLAADARV